jgi:hypothetical protein
MPVNCEPWPGNTNAFIFYIQINVCTVIFFSFSRYETKGFFAFLQHKLNFYCAKITFFCHKNGILRLKVSILEKIALPLQYFTEM